MATPTTLADLAAQTDALYKAVLTTARGELAAAQKDLALATKQQGDGATALAATQKTIATLEASLPAAKTPADAAKILADIAAAEVKARGQGAALLDDGDALAAAQARMDAVTGWVAALQPRATAAAAAVAPAQAEKKRRDTWKTAALAPPLATVAKDANTLLGKGVKDAQKRVSDEFPTDLADAVAAAWSVETARLARVEGELGHAWTAWDSEETTNGGAEGKAASFAHALAMKDEALRRWAEQGAQRYARAQAQVADVLAGTTLLSPAEKAALAADAKGPVAAQARTKREKAVAKVPPAEEGVTDAVLDARATSPETADVSTVPAVITATGNRDQAVADVGTEGKDYVGQETAWGLWSGNVPDEVWAKVAGLNEAVDTLDELKTVKAQDLVDEDTKAESDLAGELWKQVRHEVTVTFLQAQVALRGAVLDQALASRPARLVAGLRGDA
ncbi:MAG: hypothetical protein JO306_13895 [Gemmatimonadetes bacterium]|nr:hypothetical protein [Gemmatimonadota bacterium]